MVDKAKVAKGVGAYLVVKRLMRIGLFLAAVAVVLKVLHGRASD